MPVGKRIDYPGTGDLEFMLHVLAQQVADARPMDGGEQQSVPKRKHAFFGPAYGRLAPSGGSSVHFK